jgi:glycosyltransferase involved in cell wall biosynthesis
MTHRIAFVAPLPPPVHGFSHMCGLMLQRFREQGVVDVFDRAPHPRGTMHSVVLQARRLVEYAGSCLRHRKTALYLGLSGGRGQFIDLFYVLISRLFRRDIFVHHHSYSYINSSSLLNKCFFRFVKNENHVALTQGMGAALSKKYDLDTRKVRVVSNAAFFGVDNTDAPRRPRSTASEIRIGYLSNITFEKGFAEFFAILRALKQQRVAFKATIAGPLAAGAREQFESLMADSAETEYIGPVYREAKQFFYEQLDVFVFPTKYPNEAEPLVLYEAMNASAYVVACDRGGIREMIGDAGLVAPEASIVERAAECITHLSQNRAELISAQKAALSRVRQLHAEAALALRDFLNDVLAI